MPYRLILPKMMVFSISNNKEYNNLEMNTFKRESTRYERNEKKWPLICRKIGDYFNSTTLQPSFHYDKSRYLKLDRQTFKYNNKENKINSKFDPNILSDHKPIFNHDNTIMTWNTLHHYSFNGTNDYVTLNGGEKEARRYVSISNYIIREINSKNLKCLSFQEFEFYFPQVLDY